MAIDSKIADKAIIWLLFMMACSYLPVAMAEDIAIVTHIDNASQPISKSDAINIFLGRFRQFKDGTIAKPIDNKASQTIFYKRLVNKSSAQIKAYWARLIFSGRTTPPLRVADTNQVLNRIQRDKQIISYIPVSRVTDNVKVLLILKEEQ